MTAACAKQAVTSLWCPTGSEHSYVAQSSQHCQMCQDSSTLSHCWLMAALGLRLRPTWLKDAIAPSATFCQAAPLQLPTPMSPAALAVPHELVCWPMLLTAGPVYASILHRLLEGCAMLASADLFPENLVQPSCTPMPLLIIDSSALSAMPAPSGFAHSCILLVTGTLATKLLQPCHSCILLLVGSAAAAVTAVSTAVALQVPSSRFASSEVVLASLRGRLGSALKFAWSRGCSGPALNRLLGLLATVTLLLPCHGRLAGQDLPCQNIAHLERESNNM